MKNILIDVKGLTKVYRAGRTEAVSALRGADLTVAEGEFISLVGASGSGKSTLLHIMGFMDRPTGGEHWFESRLMQNLTDGEMTQIRSREIGFLFQTFNLIPSLSALENVAFPARFVHGLSAAERRERALALLELVGLADRAGHRPAELSGGQRQRVAIARALINRPKLLLADEPTGNLDSATTAKIVELFARLHKEGQTILLVTHNPEVAARAETIYRMRDGVLNRVGTSEYAKAAIGDD